MLLLPACFALGSCGRPVIEAPADTDDPGLTTGASTEGPSEPPTATSGTGGACVCPDGLGTTTGSLGAPLSEQLPDVGETSGVYRM